MGTCCPSKKIQLGVFRGSKFSGRGFLVIFYRARGGGNTFDYSRQYLDIPRGHGTGVAGVALATLRFLNLLYNFF